MRNFNKLEKLHIKNILIGSETKLLSGGFFIIRKKINAIFSTKQKQTNK